MGGRSGSVDFMSSQSVTNADEVLEFVQAHPRGVKYEVGEQLVLPDIEQRYTVTEVRPAKVNGRWQVYLDFEASCAVDDCGRRFACTKTVAHLRTSPYFIRTCAEHRGSWRSPMEHAWLTSDALECLQRAEATAVAEARERRKQQPPREGKVERTVLTVLEGLELVCERVAQHELIRHAMAALDAPPAGYRDTRRQVAVRAVQNLARKGRLRLVDGWVET